MIKDKFESPIDLQDRRATAKEENVSAEERLDRFHPQRRSQGLSAELIKNRRYMIIRALKRKFPRRYPQNMPRDKVWQISRERNQRGNGQVRNPNDDS